MRILVCGSRTYQNAEKVMIELDTLFGDLDEGTAVTIVEGGASGADAFAGEWAEQMRFAGVEHEMFPADWDRHGKAAGHLRNQQMLESGIDLCVAFVDKLLAESKGTADMVRRAQNALIPTIVYHN